MSEATDQRWHCGWPPPDVNHILNRVKRGLPVYWPTDPKPNDQAPYLTFAAKRGPNSER